MKNDDSKKNLKVKAGLVVALAATYLWQIVDSYIEDRPIEVYLYVGLLVSVVLALLILRDG